MRRMDILSLRMKSVRRRNKIMNNMRKNARMKVKKIVRRSQMKFLLQFPVATSSFFSAAELSARPAELSARADRPPTPFNLSMEIERLRNKWDLLCFRFYQSLFDKNRNLFSFHLSLPPTINHSLTSHFLWVMTGKNCQIKQFVLLFGNILNLS